MKEKNNLKEKSTLKNNLKKKQKINDEKGSFTIEAALVMPIIIIIIVMLLYLGFFLFNRCLITQEAYIGALRGSLYDEQLKENIFDKDIYVQNELEKQMGNKAIALRKLDWNILVENKKITVKADAFVSIPFKQLLRNNGFQNGWSISTQKENAIIHEVEIIRNIRKIEKQVEK